MAAVEDFNPRNYQVELMNIGLKQNTIIFLPTGSGKTFIALMILKRMSNALETSYSNNGKISIILVNTVVLVEQHAEYIKNHTNLTVGEYSGEMNVDPWPQKKWSEQFEKNQVLVMTTQIMCNLVNASFIDLNRVNLLIFDECHHGVSDHAMRQVMKSFASLRQVPRVIGLTATLLNGNCKLSRLSNEIGTLEVTYHSKIATVEGLSQVTGFSTNPIEIMMSYRKHAVNYVENYAIEIVNQILLIIEQLNDDDDDAAPLNIGLNLVPLDKGNKFKKKLKNMLNDCLYHLQIFGVYGGIKTLMAYKIQIEVLKKSTADFNVLLCLNTCLTMLGAAQSLLVNSLGNVEEKRQIFEYSSDQILKLLTILKSYKNECKDELCGIIFTERRFTAKIIYHLLDSLSKIDPEFSFIKCNFIVGFNNRNVMYSRESLFISKKNKEVLKMFTNKQINLLIASNVLEEGVDIPKCSLVVKFDFPKDYRSYVQSKGRARHKDSLYYMMISKDEEAKVETSYELYLEIEKKLNDYLIGNTANRPEPSQLAIERMYNEDEIPAYFVNGPGSAQINMVSAVSLLNQYCQSIPCDIYTQYEPEWYVNERSIINSYTVVIKLPTVCPVIEPIIGDTLSSLKSAKRAAALRACIQLHKAGEIGDDLIPRINVLPEESVGFLFEHYPSVKESNAGTQKLKRLHEKPISNFVKGSITSETNYFLHIIDLNPLFSNQSDDIHKANYSSDLCYGIISPKRLPSVCPFPLYVSSGQIDVEIKTNVKEVFITKQDLYDIKQFQMTILRDMLRIPFNFFIFDNSDEAEALLFVPVDKRSLNVEFDVLRQSYNITAVNELSEREIQKLEVSRESYQNKIVIPTYRDDMVYYVVTDVCFTKNAFTAFPNKNYTNYLDYFKSNYSVELKKPDLPLLVTKRVTKKINFIKPRKHESKRKHEKVFEEQVEHLLPELVMKYDFPVSLWIQANCLPTILHRLHLFLNFEQLRRQIATEANLGSVYVEHQPPLRLDENPPLNHNIFSVKDINLNDAKLEVKPLRLNSKTILKSLESEYPWKNAEEPMDIERNLDVSLVNIEEYLNFIHLNKNSNSPEKYISKIESPNKKIYLPPTLDNFKHRPIKMLNKNSSLTGPTLSDLYRALTSAKANDIVNLERLETLGDSFLKFIASLYCSLRFTQFNEGRLTELKGRLVSNKNLFYLARKKNLGGLLNFHEISPRQEWVPPGFTVPTEMARRIKQQEISIKALINLQLSSEEQLSGNLNITTLSNILNMECQCEEDKIDYTNREGLLRRQMVGDKHVADTVESLLGLYFQTCGFLGGIKFIEWIGIIPKSENLEQILLRPAPNPILSQKASQEAIEFLHLSDIKDIENSFGYTFKNYGFLLQALTHSSYTFNRITLPYEKLEFLGDAILDFLITCYIFETYEKLNPGELTDLRSALVNNNTFASFSVKYNLHKHLLLLNSHLQSNIDTFVEYFEKNGCQINEDLLILLNEDDVHLAECVDVPKALGDVFEAMAGAIYLDSGKDLTVVWKVFYKLMSKEIEEFGKNIPKNSLRVLYEMQGIEPVFGNPRKANNDNYLIPLQFLLNGDIKTVHGCGSNKSVARKAAAKMALRMLKI